MNPESSADQAAEWTARLDAGPLTRAEAEALTRWLDADPANEGCLEEMQRLQKKVRLVLPDMAATGRLPEKKRRPLMRPVWAWGGAIAAMLVLSVVWLMQRPVAFSTAVAQRETVTLADGTRAELNARTTLRVWMRGTERRVRLEGGEVLFTVVKDASRPFVVETSAGRVRVTGTVFNLNNFAPDSLAVVLLEGSVEATPVHDEKVRRLAPGDELVVENGRSDLRRLSAGELADAVAWREGKIVFHGTPLALALEKFARHHARIIEVAPAARSLELGGRFGLDDFDGFLKDLEVALPVVVMREADGRIRVERIQGKEK